jgi:hypothetical protein
MTLQFVGYFCPPCSAHDTPHGDAAVGEKRYPSGIRSVRSSPNALPFV